MIQFYLVEVMPQAENHGPEIKEHLNSLGEKLKTLRVQLRRCVSRPVFSLEVAHPIPPLKPSQATSIQRHMQVRLGTR